MYSLLCVFISQYSNKVDFISMGETQIGTSRKLGARPTTGIAELNNMMFMFTGLHAVECHPWIF